MHYALTVKLSRRFCFPGCIRNVEWVQRFGYSRDFETAEPMLESEDSFAVAWLGEAINQLGELVGVAFNGKIFAGYF
ncbi:hypothetical protein GCM10007423_60280 [Dyadobacter endophyticus]|uniref:Uncharacterized protein n=1 Tax=Dyadobacter endophyticus TaxID=1749036 RepID=A0ABQ1ZBC1_9BACT|nr:hypothetical protein GCM10007423_60280 [Dyadobacter endophyticus]